METTKLTLRPSKEVVELAHQLAEDGHTSITQMFSAYILSLQKRRNITRSRHRLGPLTKSVSGIVKLPDDFDEKEYMGDVFSEKYGIGK